MLWNYGTVVTQNIHNNGYYINLLKFIYSSTHSLLLPIQSLLIHKHFFIVHHAQPSTQGSRRKKNHQTVLKNDKWQIIKEISKK